MSLRWTDDDAQLLRRLREQAGQERANFARRNTLSVAQLAELEEGGHGRFYNDQIKARAGHSLLRKLGHAPAASAAARAGLMPAGEAPSEHPPVTAPTPRAAPMAVRVPLPQPGKAARLGPSLALGLMALAAIAGVFVATRGSRTAPAPAPQAVVAALPAPVEAPAPAPATAAASAEVVPAQAPQATASAPTATPLAPAVAVAASGATVSAVSAASGAIPVAPARCAPVPAAGVAQFTPPNALRPANYVHLESSRDIAVCVVDARGQATAAVVRPGEGTSIYGEAPFTVQPARGSGQWEDLRVFFQGARVHVDTPVPPAAIALHAR